jgi:hypothetical protein
MWSLTQYKNNFRFLTLVYFYKLENGFRKQKLLFLNTHMMCLVLNSAPIPAITEPSKFKSTSIKTSIEMLRFLNLSPYNSSSQSKPRRISNQLDYIQDRIIQHNSSTLQHFTNSSSRRLHPSESQIYYNTSPESSGRSLHTRLVQILKESTRVHIPQKHLEKGN